MMLRFAPNFARDCVVRGLRFRPQTYSHSSCRRKIMQQGAHIGPSVVIKGEISSREPLIVSGRVDGTIDAPGQLVTIAASAHVSADVTAGGIIVSGTVKGALVAEDRIALMAGADVEGDLRSPRIAVDDGAFVCGKAQIAGPRDIDLARAS
jgi:cytoskeletal protein CcmA (bactofilin family)